MKSEQSRKPQFPILLLLISFASVGAVLFTPGLPSIASFFHVTAGQAQLTVTTYLIGYALGQLPYGPLANRFGRKTTLYIGISLSIGGSLLSALSSPLHSFGLLVCARFLQALGACVGLKISFTMIADVYTQTEATKTISRAMLAFALMPGLAVAIGGWLTALLGWESCFYFLALFGALVLWVSSKLPETATSLDRRALHFPSILRGYATKFTNRQLVICGLLMGCGSAVIYLFATKSPFIGIRLIGLSPQIFGTWNLIPLVGMFLGALLAGKLAGRFPVQRLLFTGILASLVAVLTMLLPFSMGIITPWTLFFPVCLIYLAESLVFANASSMGLAHAKNKSYGSAVLNFINLGVAVIGVFIAEFVYPESALLLPLSFIFFLCVMLLLWIWLKRLEKV